MRTRNVVWIVYMKIWKITLIPQCLSLKKLLIDGTLILRLSRIYIKIVPKEIAKFLTKLY
jgi:hypothetical protein